MVLHIYIEHKLIDFMQLMCGLDEASMQDIGSSRYVHAQSSY